MTRVAGQFSHRSQWHFDKSQSMCLCSTLPTSHHLVMDDHEGSAQQMKGLPTFLPVNSVSDTCLAIGVTRVLRADVYLAHRCNVLRQWNRFGAFGDATFTKRTLCQSPWHLKPTRLGPQYRAEQNSCFAGLTRNHSKLAGQAEANLTF